MADQTASAPPYCIISPTALWQAVAASDRRYILIGDGDHRDHDIPRALTEGLPHLGAQKVRALAMESNFDTLGRICERFNAASEDPYFPLLEQKILRAALSCIATNWDKTPERLAARQEIMFNQFVTAHDHGLRLCPISTLNHGPYDLLSDVSEETRERLEKTERYLLENDGRWPAFYEKNPMLHKLDITLMTQAHDQMNKKNLGMDVERAMIVKSLASQNGRVAVYFGAGHFRGVQSTGIDGNLPAREQVYVLIAAQAAIFSYIEQISTRQPDFILRLDKKEGHVMQAAVTRGLWPAAAV